MLAVVGIVAIPDVLEFTTASFPFDIIGELLGFELGFGVPFKFGIIPPPPPKVNFVIDPVGSKAGALLDSVDEEATIFVGDEATDDL